MAKRSYLFAFRQDMATRPESSHCYWQFDFSSACCTISNVFLDSKGLETCEHLRLSHEIAYFKSNLVCFRDKTWTNSVVVLLVVSGVTTSSTPNYWIHQSKPSHYFEWTNQKPAFSSGPIRFTRFMGRYYYWLKKKPGVSAEDKFSLTARLLEEK